MKCLFELHPKCTVHAHTGMESLFLVIASDILFRNERGRDEDVGGSTLVFVIILQIWENKGENVGSHETVAFLSLSSVAFWIPSSSLAHLAFTQ